MKFKYDIKKSEQLRRNPKRGIGFNDVQELFEHYYYEDLRCDDPTQYSATGWVQGKLYTVIYEQRFDNEGLYYHLVTGAYVGCQRGQHPMKVCIITL